jgi:hypothetical protein
VPVWVALSYAADYRWLLEHEDSPWYPTMRLLRQPHLGNWNVVFERMAGELRSLVQLTGPDTVLDKVGKGMGHC